MKTKIKAAVVLLLVIAGVLRWHTRAAAASDFVIPVPAAPGTAAQNKGNAVIDYSNTKDGYVMVKYAKNTSKPLRAIVKDPGGVSYVYSLKAGKYEVFPLSGGSGSYTIGVYENVGGSKYAVANTATVKVALADEFAPFLRPNQYVNYNKDSRTVKEAAGLVRDSGGLIGEISAMYNYVISNIAYDRDAANSVRSGYLPDVDAALGRGKGICFDYAAVMTAMLRGRGIPCKLAVGYSGKVYHAWINAYSKETGWVNQVIYFEGSNWQRMDPTFASSGNQSGEIMKYIGDGRNYTEKFIY
jgi:hypothetical protein